MFNFITAYILYMGNNTNEVQVSSVKWDCEVCEAVRSITYLDRFETVRTHSNADTGRKQTMNRKRDNLRTTRNQNLSEREPATQSGRVQFEPTFSPGPRQR